MATTYSWGYSNSTPSEKTATVQNLGSYSNYGRVQDEPTVCELSNKTSPLDQPEEMFYKARQEKVSTSNLTNPPKSRDGVYYSVTVKDILRATLDDGTEYDHPIDCIVAFRHDTAHNWTDDQVAHVLARALGALYNETDDGWRFKDLQRSALAPIED